ncbi:MAG: hypothetical protein RIT07_1645 [Bacteroidota bacterium]|jgi:hypothetical protein
MANYVLSDPFLRCKGDKFFSYRVKNLFFLSNDLNRKFVNRKMKRFQRREINTKCQNSQEP